MESSEKRKLHGIAVEEICGSEMKYLNVAKKNDDAKTIASQLSNEKITIEIYLLYREGFSKFNKNSEFEPAQRNNNRFSTRKPELLSKLEDSEME
uniref:Uncharacterized protein n=1 Tax=Glossina palpalis gambiensis TaxID=67801 RepID=A0A1B0C111_9MUSC